MRDFAFQHQNMSELASLPPRIVSITLYRKKHLLLAASSGYQLQNEVLAQIKSWLLAAQLNRQLLFVHSS